MKKQTKWVEFDLFRPYYLIENENGTTKESPYDLKSFLNHISKYPLINTKRKILGDNYLFHVCQKEQNSSIWEIQILHLREQILPGIADEDGAYELIELSEEQYPAESTTILYDEDTYIIYIQRNRYGTSLRALTGLIQLISPEETYVVLKPLIQRSKIDKVMSAKKHTKIIVTVDSEQLPPEQHSPCLRNILDTFSAYQGRIVKIELGFGRKKGNCLNSAETVALLKEAYEFTGTDKLVVSVMESEDSKIEKIDLLDDRMKYFLEMQYSRKEPITHERLYARCLEEIRKAN